MLRYMEEVLCKQHMSLIYTILLWVTTKQTKSHVVIDNFLPYSHVAIAGKT